MGARTIGRSDHQASLVAPQEDGQANEIANAQAINGRKVVTRDLFIRGRYDSIHYSEAPSRRKHLGTFDPFGPWADGRFQDELL